MTSNPSISLSSFTAVATVMAGLATACATGITLTTEGERVSTVTRAELPIGCNLLGDVAVGIPPDAARPRTEEALVILLRNKAADRGGTHVIVESKSERLDSHGRPLWRGRGIAYACAENRVGAAATAGGESTVQRAPTDEDGAAVEGDPRVDDLLGD